MPAFQTSDGVRLHYQDWGRGRPIVFVHSWALDAQMWAPHMLHVNALGFRAVAMDRRGHGRSEQPGEGYDYDRLADDLFELLEHLDLRDAVLVGHSMGTAECTRLLARHGSARVARCVYLAPVAPLLVDAQGRRITAATAEPELAAIRADFPRWLEEGADGFFRPAETGVAAGIIRRTIDIMLSTSLRAAEACFLTRIDGDLRADLRRVDVPLLVLHGTRDVSEPLSHGQAVAALARDARLEIYEGAPHGLYHTHRERVLADIARFAGAVA